ncbi:MAG: DNA-binding winged helix-turn-helix (wHTH) protein [Alteromonadaceae bacterium]|jgi:DNA-binding winged helix-turn-helix (wHTH) protein
MKRRHTLIFDQLTHTVTVGTNALTLNPLSFRLLEALANYPEEILSVEHLISKVWQKTRVSPDTLKQRVFVLRKSIEEANILGLTIQAIRGEGYRLIIEVPDNEVYSDLNVKSSFLSIKPNFLFKYVGFTLTLLVTVFFLTKDGYVFSHKESSTNNRVVLWTNIEQHNMPKSATDIYEQWFSLLSTKSAEGKLQLVLADRLSNVLIPIQARKNNVAIISYFEVIETNKTTTIRLSIIEPRTAAILRTNTINLESNSNLKETLKSQAKGILALVSSGKLYLSKKQQEFTQSPIWAHLKTLANPT